PSRPPLARLRRLRREPAGAATLHDREMLRSNAVADFKPFADGRLVQYRPTSPVWRLHNCIDAGPAQLAMDDVHGGRPDELRDEQVSRTIVELEWFADLFDHAIVHDDDAIGHRHSLYLIMRHIYRRRFGVSN